MIGMLEAYPQKPPSSMKLGGITLYKWDTGSKRAGRYYLAVLPQVKRPQEILGVLMEPEYVLKTRTTRGTMEITGKGGEPRVFYKPASGFEKGGIRYKPSAVREARALFHIMKIGRKAEEPLAIYFDSSGNQALIAKKAEGRVLSDQGIPLGQKLEIFSTEQMALAASGIQPVDMSFNNIIMDRHGDAVTIDAEAYLVPSDRKMERDIARMGIIEMIANAAKAFKKFLSMARQAES